MAFPDCTLPTPRLLPDAGFKGIRLRVSHLGGFTMRQGRKKLTGHAKIGEEYGRILNLGTALNAS